MTPLELIILTAATIVFLCVAALIQMAMHFEKKALRYKSLADDRLIWALHGMDLWLKAKERIAELEEQLKEVEK
ncbi:MAG: hypothetical protein F9K24_20685 [Leptonema illini]|uniref:Uncharacterized protein n=1 Tax=Leptonema illini TaxID=183 RepID=A0A833GXJ5_9LEPT|nr:MAG: hypothetical protein F9K24_20685 [Leptonema illini]